MAQPVFYQTVNQLGMDPTQYYSVSASVTPETPAAPFLVGTRGFGSDGSEFVFVQASTSISLTDFVLIGSSLASWAAPYTTNSLSDATVVSSLAIGIGATGLVVKGSVSYIPAGAFFWAQTRGQYIPATTSAGLASNVGGVALYTTVAATAGVITSVSTSSSLHAALAGIICVNSLTVSIPSSIVPAAGGTLSSTGYTVGPVVNLNLPRAVVLTSLTFGTLSLNVFSF